MGDQDQITGGQALVRALEAQSVNRIFCVPGESYLAVLDALTYSPIETIVCRQEGGAAMMADAEGRLTARPGICFVTRGPGTTNALAGLHIARQDSVPLILFIGQVQAEAREREAFQEIEYRRFLPEVTKWVAEIDDPARIPELVARAFTVAMSGRPGPVALALPEDMLRTLTDRKETVAATQVVTAPGPDIVDAVLTQLKASKRPIAILGGTGWSAEGVGAFTRFAERWSLPVVCSFRRQMLFDHDHPNYAGDSGIGINPRLAERIRSADTVLLVGGRYGEMPSSNYTLLKSPIPNQNLIHVYPDASELGRVYRPTIAVNASPDAFAIALRDVDPPTDIRWKRETEAARKEYLSWSQPPSDGVGAVHMGPIMAYLNKRLPDDAILCNGAGNYASWIHRYYRFQRFGTQAAPASGSMGYGVPAAVGCKIMMPEKTVIAFAGDGCFLMNGQEFATAVQYDAAIIVIVVDNEMYGTIRMHQERGYPGRVSGTALKNPDFAAYARAFGGFGTTVEKTSDFELAFEAAVASGLPSIIHIKLDPQAITPTKTLDEIREGL